MDADILLGKVYVDEPVSRGLPKYDVLAHWLECLGNDCAQV
jgi:hypothetical protein